MQKLPPGWAETTDARGRTYFYNAETQESSWTPPPGTTQEQPPQQPPQRQGPPSIPGAVPMFPTPKPLEPTTISPTPSTQSQSSQRPPGMPQLPPLPMTQPGSMRPPPINIPSTGSQPPSAPVSPANSQSSRAPPPFPGLSPMSNHQGGPPPLPRSTASGPPPLSGIARAGPPALPGSIAGTPAVSAAPPPLPGTSAPPALSIPSSVPPQRSGPPPITPPAFTGQSQSLPPPLNAQQSTPTPTTTMTPGFPPMMSRSGTVPPLPTQPPASRPSMPPLPASTGGPRPSGARPPPPPMSGLPPPWKEATANDGRTYYYNTVTQEVSWTRPGGAGRPTISGLPAFPPHSPAGGRLSVSPGTPTVQETKEPKYSKNFAGTISVRSGVFKSWSSQYITIKPQSQLQLYDNEQMKKVRLQVNVEHCIAIPVTRGDGKIVICLYEYDKKHLPVNKDALTSHASKVHYFDAGVNDTREVLLETLENQGALIRRPIVELPCSWNKNPDRFCTVYHHQLELYKKSTDDEPEIIVPFAPGTFFQSEPSVFPLLYEEKEYGPVSPQTFVIGDHCDDGATLYYITLTLAEGYESLIKKTGQAIEERKTKVDPDSLMEGYLYKASSNLTRWARRFFILRNDSLKYYKERGGSKPAGEIPLPLGFEIDMHPKTEYPFSIFVAESGDAGTRQYLTSALNQTEYNLWSDALTKLQQKKQIKKDNSSQKEGYAFICGQKTKPLRKYAVITAANTLQIYNTRNDTMPSSTLQLATGMMVSEASLPGDDIVQSQKLNILSISDPSNAGDDTYLGFGSAPTREDWINVLKGIVGDGVVKCHPESVKEGYVYKSKKRGKTGSIKYVVITPRAIYYADTKTPNIADAPKAKKWDLCGDAPIVELDEHGMGFYGLELASTGDESGIYHMYLYFSEQGECQEYRQAIKNAMLTVDWRRDPSSIFEGYIYKSNTSGKSWQYRYHVLYKHSMVYYKRKYDEKPAGQIPINPGFTLQTISYQDTSITGEHRTAVDHFASTLKLKKTEDVQICAVVPSAQDTSSRRIWLGSTDPSVLLSWVQMLNELLIWDKQQYPYGVKEGYLFVNGYGPESRKYVALFNEKIIVQKSKSDSTLELTQLLEPGFDIIAYDDHFYIRSTPHDDLSQYVRFASCFGGDSVQSWLSAFQSVYKACTPQPTPDIKFQSYLYAQTTPGGVVPHLQKSIRFVVLTADTLALFDARALCYPKSTNTGIDLTGASSVQQYNRITLTQEGKLEVSQGPHALDITVRLGDATYIFTARTESEKMHTFNTLTAAFAGQTHSRASVAARPAAFAVAPPPPMDPEDEEEAPPPPTFFDEDEDDFPPPPPPDEDDIFYPVPVSAPPTVADHASAPPSLSKESSIPMSTGSVGVGPVAIAANDSPEFQPRKFAPPSTQSFQPPTARRMPVDSDSDDDEDSKPPGFIELPPVVGSSPAPAMPPPMVSSPPAVNDDSDSDDDLPFLKARKLQQQQSQPVVTTSAPSAPAYGAGVGGPAAPSSYSAAPSQGSSSLGLDFGFDFAFELPPPPDDLALPPPPMSPVAPPPVVSSPPPVAAVATPSPYAAYDEDDDDDDLPPPPGGKK